ncbi:helix-turn-helix domain-containing protein [Enterovirga rhinocerotis]|uniref:Helix-turn-helix protein n=1 Tax=Enterovirga rhinocerotis TaxID=1339210 RepID=A0A4R7CAG9_9HYPH|nr:helix-turn-helix transcriptional regulator [Enterovirga rhinocerotis]TDR95472.1 helix-turn-helix protein [Enterovirga rhinocerotis]
MDVRRIIGLNARRYRLQAGLSQEAVAERMGVDRAYISGLEGGRRNPTVITMWHLSVALQIPLPAFFERPEDDESIYRQVSLGA